jgi:nitrate reductase NapD
MEAPRDPTRRNLLMGRLTTIHISSAVVSVLPAHRENVVRLLSDMDGVEVHHQSPTKIIIVMEGPDSGVLGARLAEIASIEGVLSANMVFEQTDLGEQQ